MGSDGTGGPNGSSIQVYSGGSSRKINNYELLLANYQRKSWGENYLFLFVDGMGQWRQTEGMIKDVYMSR